MGGDSKRFAFADGFKLFTCLETSYLNTGQIPGYVPIQILHLLDTSSNIVMKFNVFMYEN